MTKLIIVRHGNTFASGETPRRVGARTDLSLVESGEDQARKLGSYMRENDLLPDIVYTSRLKRTIETANILLEQANLRRPLHQSDMFDEIDHGPDENKTDAEIVARLGEKALKDWDELHAMPAEWSPRPDVLRKRWADFAAHAQKYHMGKNVLIVTSNGMARFAPSLARNPQNITKMATGAFSILEHDDGYWVVRQWNVKP